MTGGSATRIDIRAIAAVEPVRLRTSEEQREVGHPVAEVGDRLGEVQAAEVGDAEQVADADARRCGGVSHRSAPRCRRRRRRGASGRGRGRSRTHGGGVLAGGVVELLEERLEAPAELGGTFGGQSGEAARSGGACAPPTRPGPPRSLPRRIESSTSARAVSNTAQERLVEDSQARRPIGREQRSVELERERRDAVPGLDDPGHDAPLGRPDEVALQEQLDVVVEAGLRELERGGQLLHGPGRVTGAGPSSRGSASGSRR